MTKGAQCGSYEPDPRSARLPAFSSLAASLFADGGRDLRRGYAVLPYVAQAAVSSFGWPRPGEMLGGLAMVQTTPGPLVLMFVYVGFLAAFRSPPGIDPLWRRIARWSE